MKYILCDMDGTLLNSNKQLPKNLNSVITYLKKQNVVFGVASGRQYFNLYEQFPVHQNNMIFIAENGGVLYEGQHPLHANAMSCDEAKPVIEAARACPDAYPIVCGVKCAYLEDDDPIFLENAHMYYAKIQIVDDLLDVIKQDQIAKITIYDKKNAETNCYPFIKPHTGSLKAVVSAEAWVDVSNPNVSKGHAIQMLKQKYNLTSNDFVAFGDFMNDYEMMQECFYSYAMANAHPELKKVCRYHTSSNDEDGVIKALCELYQIEETSL